jgi:hypothetical protein
MSQPYSRVVVLHLTIIGGAFLVASLGTPLALLVLLILLKTAVDLRAHLREHRKAQEAQDRDAGKPTLRERLQRERR